MRRDRWQWQLERGEMAKGDGSMHSEDILDELEDKLASGVHLTVV
jgi:hypothetical protein